MRIGILLHQCFLLLEGYVIAYYLPIAIEAFITVIASVCNLSECPVTAGSHPYSGISDLCLNDECPTIRSVPHLYIKSAIALILI
jgi:hypothetical protein